MDVWWRDDGSQDELELAYKHILGLEARIAKLVAHQVRVRRLLMQESSEEMMERVTDVQREVEHYLRLLRMERQEKVDRYERMRIERSLGQVRHSTAGWTSSLPEWDSIEEKLALEVEQLRRVLAYDQRRRDEEGW